MMINSFHGRCWPRPTSSLAASGIMAGSGSEDPGTVLDPVDTKMVSHLAKWDGSGQSYKHFAFKIKSHIKHKSQPLRKKMHEVVTEAQMDKSAWGENEYKAPSCTTCAPCWSRAKRSTS